MKHARLTESELKAIRERVIAYANTKEKTGALEDTKKALHEVTRLDPTEIDELVDEILDEIRQEKPRKEVTLPPLTSLIKMGLLTSILIALMFILYSHRQTPPQVLNQEQSHNQQPLTYDTETPHGIDDKNLVAIKHFDLFLYPDKDLPYPVSIKFDRDYEVESVGVSTDWWQKRPITITILDKPGGKILGRRIFPDYLTHICGYDFNSKCKHPDERGSATAQLRVPLSQSVRAEALTVQLDGLLSPANKYVILKGIRVYGEI